MLSNADTTRSRDEVVEVAIRKLIVDALLDRLLVLLQYQAMGQSFNESYMAYCAEICGSDISCVPEEVDSQTILF